MFSILERGVFAKASEWPPILLTNFFENSAWIPGRYQIGLQLCFLYSTDKLWLLVSTFAEMLKRMGTKGQFPSLNGWRAVSILLVLGPPSGKFGFYGFPQHLELPGFPMNFWKNHFSLCGQNSAIPT
jgi:hypothetical protein